VDRGESIEKLAGLLSADEYGDVVSEVLVGILAEERKRNIFVVKLQELANELKTIEQEIRLTPMTVQLILKPPSGVSVTSSSFAKAGSGIYTCTQTIESGDNVRSIEVRLTGNEVGTHEIESEVYYMFEGSSKSPTRYETLTLVVDPDTRSADSESKAREIVVPGFGGMVAVMGLLAVYLWRKRR